MSEAFPAAGDEGHRCSRQRCAHGPCRQCDGCADCDRAGHATVTRCLLSAAGDIERALCGVKSAHAALTVLTHAGLPGADLAEDGQDATAKLTRISEELCDVARIIDVRQLTRLQDTQR